MTSQKTKDAVLAAFAALDKAANNTDDATLVAELTAAFEAEQAAEAAVEADTGLSVLERTRLEAGFEDAGAGLALDTAEEGDLEEARVFADEARAHLAAVVDLACGRLP